MICCQKKTEHNEVQRYTEALGACLGFIYAGVHMTLSTYPILAVLSALRFCSYYADFSPP